MQQKFNFGPGPKINEQHHQVELGPGPSYSGYMIDEEKAWEKMHCVIDEQPPEFALRDQAAAEAAARGNRTRTRNRQPRNVFDGRHHKCRCAGHPFCEGQTAESMRRQIVRTVTSICKSNGNQDVQIKQQRDNLMNGQWILQWHGSPVQKTVGQNLQLEEETNHETFFCHVSFVLGGLKQFCPTFAMLKLLVDPPERHAPPDLRGPGMVWFEFVPRFISIFQLTTLLNSEYKWSVDMLELVDSSTSVKTFEAKYLLARRPEFSKEHVAWPGAAFSRKGKSRPAHKKKADANQSPLLALFDGPESAPAADPHQQQWPWPLPRENQDESDDNDNHAGDDQDFNHQDGDGDDLPPFLDGLSDDANDANVFSEGESSLVDALHELLQDQDQPDLSHDQTQVEAASAEANAKAEAEGLDLDFDKDTTMNDAGSEHAGPPEPPEPPSGSRGAAAASASSSSRSSSSSSGVNDNDDALPPREPAKDGLPRGRATTERFSLWQYVKCPMCGGQVGRFKLEHNAGGRDPPKYHIAVKTDGAADSAFADRNPGKISRTKWEEKDCVDWIHKHKKCGCHPPRG